MVYGHTMSLVRCLPYDWVSVHYSLKKEDNVWLISKGWDKHSSLFTRQKPGAFVIPAPIWTAGFFVFCSLAAVITRDLLNSKIS